MLKGPCIVKGDSNEFIGSVIDGLASEFSGRTVNRLIISTSENFSSCHEVSLNTPLLALQEFGCKYVCCFMERPDSSANVPGRPAVRDAFSVLMERSRELVLPATASAAQDRELRADQRLRNAVLDVLGGYKIGWSPDLVVSTGEAFVGSLVQALWYLDANRKQFQDRGIHLASRFDSLQVQYTCTCFADCA